MPLSQAEGFRYILARQRRVIKTGLMDPKVLAGVGNIYSDEALWRARIHPARRANSLTPSEVRKLHKELRLVLKELGVVWWRIPGLLRRGRKDFRNSLADLKIQPGFKELVYKLKELGLKQAIVSTNSAENIKEFLQKNGLDVFEIIYGGGSLFNKAKNIKRLMKNYSLRPSEIIYIGDEVRDIEAAQKAGVKIISVSWGFNTGEVLRKYNPGRVIDKPEELLNLI